LNARSELDRDNVQAVCIDMSNSFLGAIQNALPHAEVVVDRFHVMQLAVKVMDKVRRQEQRGLPKGDKAPLFKTRYMLTKPSDELSDEQLLQREEIRAHYPAIDEAAVIVEDLRDWYNRSYKYLGAARNSLNRIIDNAASSESKQLQTLAKTLTDWKEPIVAYMRWYITNGPTEGTNNKVKTIKRAAYGHRCRINLKTRILAQSR
jgi:transposase